MNTLHHKASPVGGDSEILRALPDAIPQQLRCVPQWLCWRLDTKGHKKPKKVPLGAKTGQHIDATNPRNLAPFEDALALYLDGRADGIGFAFTPNDPFAGIDLDNCRNPRTGALHARAKELLRELDTYAEVSVSGTGVHAVVIGALSAGGPNRGEGIEIYDRSRYFTFTGHRLPNSRATVNDRGALLRAIQERLRPAPTEPAHRASTGTTFTGTGFAGATDELLAVAFAAKNGARVRARWEGEMRGTETPSEALLSLARFLAFYTGPDEDHLERLIVQSPLYAATEAKRVKWASARKGGTWGRVHVVREAIKSCSDFYRGRGVTGADGPARASASGVRSRAGRAFQQVLKSPPTCVPTYGHPRGTTRARLHALLQRLSLLRDDGRIFVSERDAAKHLKVSRTAVRKALAALRKSGSLVLIHRGTFPARRNSEYRLVSDETDRSRNSRKTSRGTRISL